MAINRGSLPPVRIVYHGLFDWEELHKLIMRHFKKTGWTWQEKKYKHKPWNYLGEELELSWIFDREVTEYIKDHVDMAIYIIEMRPVDQVINGVKKKLYQGRIRITIEAKFIMDYRNDFQKNNFWKSAQTFLNKQILKKELDFKHDGRLYYEMYAFHAKLKKFLNMYADFNAYG